MSVLARRTAVGRDAAVATTGATAILLTILAQAWLVGALALVATVLWIFVRRSENKRLSRFLFLAVVVLGTALLWRFAERRVWISWFGMVALVAAVDLDRLAARFPHESPLHLQARTIRRRLVHLAFVAGASALMVLIGANVAIELRLIAVMLLAAFVVVVLIRTVREIDRER
ncbi:MAG: hypothetical protein ACOC8L_09375 [Spirochaetota bacterium]